MIVTCNTYITTYILNGDKWASEYISHMCKAVVIIQTVQVMCQILMAMLHNYVGLSVLSAPCVNIDIYIAIALAISTLIVSILNE